MSLKSIIIEEIMEEFGITKEMVDKVKTLIDHVDIQKFEDKTIVSIKTKNISIIIDKQELGGRIDRNTYLQNLLGVGQFFS